MAETTDAFLHYVKDETGGLVDFPGVFEHRRLQLRVPLVKKALKSDGRFNELLESIPDYNPKRKSGDWIRFVKLRLKSIKQEHQHRRAQNRASKRNVEAIWPALEMRQETEEAMGEASMGVSNVEAMGMPNVEAMGMPNLHSMGMSNVEPMGMSNVEAMGMSNLHSMGMSNVEPMGMSNVEAMGMSNVAAMGVSNVEAMGVSNVAAMGVSNVAAMGVSKVEAMGMSNVEAMGMSNVEAMGMSDVGTQLADPPAQRGAVKRQLEWSDEAAPNLLQYSIALFQPHLEMFQQVLRATPAESLELQAWHKRMRMSAEAFAANLSEFPSFHSKPPVSPDPISLEELEAIVRSVEDNLKRSLEYNLHDESST